ncbi:GNAT family N-acetyltransferase [Arhodomonas aquaeolei]|uniref:GNAT family N-acetyltransferase n=1 Tax=Arhodomonas aquaeolei TaxID=2369 RepID=UPI000367A744|nr:GNAT family N-acetyltransferase [Arhodomonas aquaeolei]
MAKGMTVAVWDEAAFAAARQPWERLVADSDADPLFLGWDWLHGWWQHFGAPGGATLRLLAVQDGDGSLCGIAPMMITAERVRGVLPSRRLQLVGNFWHGAETLPTEYADFIVRRDCAETAADTLLDYLLDHGHWGELVLAWARADGHAVHALRRRAAAEGFWLRDAEYRTSYAAETTGGFEDYLAALSRNTRPKLYNRRGQLARHGEVRVERLARRADVAPGLALVNELHARRWGEAAYSGAALAFQQGLAEAVAASGGLWLSVLRVAGRPVSVLYNLRVGGRLYYLQGGFDETFDRRLSLGLLHLGYLLEAAFADPRVHALDLLAGGGRKRQYKEALAPVRTALVDVQAVRQPLLSLAYRVRERIRADADGAAGDGVTG